MIHFSKLRNKFLGSLKQAELSASSLMRSLLFKMLSLIRPRVGHDLKYQALKFMQLLTFQGFSDKSEAITAKIKQNFFMLVPLEDLRRNDRQEKIEYARQDKKAASNPTGEQAIQEFWQRAYPIDESEAFYLQKFLLVESEQDLFQQSLKRLQSVFAGDICAEVDAITEYKQNFFVFQKWFNHYIGLQGVVDDELISKEHVFKVLYRVVANSFNSQHKYQTIKSNFMIKQMLRICKSYDYKYMSNLRCVLDSFIEYYTSQVVGQFQEIPAENYRDKLDLIVPFMRVMILIIKFYCKIDDNFHLKHLLSKRVLKQPFFDQILTIFEIFPHNEEFLHIVVKFALQIFKKPELYSYIDFSRLVRFIMDTLVVHQLDLAFHSSNKL